MTQPDQPTPLPAEQSAPPAPPLPPPSRSKRWKWVVPLVAVLVVGAGVGGYLVVQAFSGFNLTGRIVINGSCDARGYKDVREGAQVEVVSQNGEVLGAGSLVRDWGRDACAYRFTVSDVPAGERLYGVRLGNSNRGTIWSNEDEARDGVLLSLGN